MSNEKEIREFVRQRFNKQFPESFTLDEFSGGTLTTRPDLATFLPNAIIFTEIKSNKDSLARYHNQIVNYKAHANNVYAILDEVHYKKWLKMNKNEGYTFRCNTYFYKDGRLFFPNGDGSGLEREAKEFSYYPNENTPISILDYLWKPELYSFLYFIKGRSKIINEQKIIKAIYTHSEIIKMSHEIIHHRTQQHIKSGHKKMQYSTCKTSVCEVGHKEYKQLLFDEIDNSRMVRKKIIKKKPTPLPMFMQEAKQKRKELQKEKKLAQ